MQKTTDKIGEKSLVFSCGTNFIEESNNKKEKNKNRIVI